MVDYLVQAQAYKLFYLIDDYTNSVFQKVFICDKNTLKTIQHRQSNNLKIYGLIGPVKQIYNHLQNYYANLMGKQKQEVKITFNHNLQKLGQQEKSAVYLIRLGQNKSKTIQNTVFLALISNDDLYYKKPINQNSLAYLLLRFIGDLCNDIIILYDNQIWSNFKEDDCPYFYSNHSQIQYTFQKASFHDIKIKRLDCQSTYVSYLSDQDHVIDYNHSFVISQNSHLQYFKKLDQKQLKSREQQSKKTIKQKIWKQLIQTGKVQFQINKDYCEHFNTQKYEQSIQKLKYIHKQCKQIIKQFSLLYIKDIQRQLFKEQRTDTQIRAKQKFAQKQALQFIYFQIFSNNQLQIKIKDDVFVIQNNTNKKMLQKLLYHYLQIFQTLRPGSQTLLQEKKNQIRDKLQFQWKACFKKLLIVFQTFFQPFEYLNSLDNSLYAEIQKIQIVKFDMNKIVNDNKVQKIQFIVQPQIVIKLGQVKKLIPNITLNSIIDFKVFKTKFLKNCKLALISRELLDSQTQQQKSQRKCEYIIASIDRDEIRVIAKYQEHRLILVFDELARKIYLFKPSDRILVTFILDDYQKSKNQKKFNLIDKKNPSNFEIISYSISKVPNQRFYFLDSRKDTLYCYDITEQCLKQFYTQVDDLNNSYLNCRRGGSYEIVKAFNHNIFIALGNKQIINVFKVDANNLLQESIYTMQCSPNQVYRGMGTYSDQINEYLVIYEKHNFIALLFENMNSGNVLVQQNKRKCLGNPIIDIFYEAKDRFGQYTTYTVNNNTPKLKQLNFHHILPNKNQSDKLINYLKKSLLIKAQQAQHFYYQNSQINKIYDKYGFRIGLLDFLNESQTRIPTQICAVEYGNILPLKDGNQIDDFYGQKGSIQQRCKNLTFGIAQRLLLEDPKKKTIVVSIMGAQSTGKSYLMNRIFGTRFTVASCRTTIGIWMSLIKTQDVNFIALDCQGLFSVHRQLNQEQKLIKILTGISDFTILNQNKSMANKSLKDLMKQISQSVKVSQIKSQELYNGSLVIVVRDVVKNEQNGISKQFYQNFHRCKQIQDFMFTLFNKNIEGKANFSMNFFSPFTEIETFALQAQNLRQNFLTKSKQKQGRTSSSILKWLKIIMTQLACDDVKLPEQVMTKINLQKILQATKTAWIYGKEKFVFEEVVNNESFVIQDQLIIIEEMNKDFNQHDTNCIESIKKLFNEKILNKKPINSVIFSKTYFQLNQYIINFFNKRFCFAMQVLKNEVKNLENKNQQFRKNLFQKQKQIEQMITKQKQKLKLCLNKCSQKQKCDQICIKKSDHKTKIQGKKKQAKIKVNSKQQWLKINKLSEQELNNKDIGIRQTIQKHQRRLDQLKQQNQRFKQQQKMNKIKNQLQQGLSQINIKIKLVQDKISNNSKYQKQCKEAITSLKKVLNIYINYREDQNTQSQLQQLTQLKNKVLNIDLFQRQSQKLQNENRLQQFKKIQSIFKEMDEQQQHINEVIQLAKTQCKDLTQQYNQKSRISQAIQTSIIQLELIQQQDENKIAQKKNNLNNKHSQNQQNQQRIQQDKSKIETNQILLNQLNIETRAIKIQIQQFTQAAEVFQKNIQNLKANLSLNKYKVNNCDQTMVKSILSLLQQKKQIQKQRKQYYILKEQLNIIFSKSQCQPQIEIQQKFKKSMRFIKANIIKLNTKKNQKNQKIIVELMKQNFILQQIKRMQISLQNKTSKYEEKVDNVIKQMFGQQQQYEQQKQFLKYMCLTNSTFVNNCKFRLQNYANPYQFQMELTIKKYMEANKNWKSKIESEYQNVQNLIQFLKTLNEKQLKTKIFQNKSEAAQLQSLLQHEQNELKLQQFSQKLGQIQSQRQKYQFLQQVLHCLKIDAIKEFEIYSILLCSPQIQEQQLQSQQNSAIEAEHLLNKQKRKQILITFQEQLKHKNKQLGIQIDKLGQTHPLKIVGKFAQTLQQIKGSIKDCIKLLQHKIYAEQNMENLKVYQMQEQIMKIQTILRSSGQQYYHYKRYFQQISKLFKAGNDKHKFPNKLLMKWVQQIEENEKLPQQQQKNNITLFYYILLIVIFEICKVNSKVQTQKQNYLNLLKEQEQRYKMFKQNSSQKIQKYESLTLRIKQIDQENYKLKTDIITKQLQMEQNKNQIMTLNKQVQIIHIKINQLKQKLQKTNTKYQNSKLQINQLRELLKSQNKKIQVLMGLKEQLPNINYTNRVKSLTAKYQNQVQQNKEFQKQIEEQKIKMADLQSKKYKMQASIQQMKNQLEKLNEKQIQQNIKEIDGNIKKLYDLQSKIEQIHKIQRQLQQLLVELQQYQKSPDNFCSCMTDHKCDMKCEMGCMDEKCSGKGGHSGAHVCGLQSHRCNKKCQMDIRCNNGCQEMVNHDQNTRHRCSNTHKCKQKCKYCDKICCVSQYDAHQQHICEQNKCKKSCILCGEQCSSTDHRHDDRTEQITRLKKLKNNEYEQRKQKLHLCGKENHKCETLCACPGVCSNKFVNQKRSWSRDGIVNQYQYIKQIQQKNQCAKLIPQGQYKHQGQCKCNVNHTCNHRCPDCQSLCYKSYNHNENERHQTTHRNQQFLIYAAQNQNQLIKVQSDKAMFIFNVGQESSPFKCNKSCQRKGRGHFHLIQCPGGQKCYQKTLKKGARHSNQVYKPHVNKKYDMLLCSQYWQLFKFQMPSSNKQFGFCNFACTFYEDHKNKQKVFCSEQAWHCLQSDRQKHKFDCDNYHVKMEINAYQICFLIDSTGSMAELIKQSMTLIKAIVANVKKIKQKIKVKFAVVGYRDHKVSQSQLFKNLKKLCLKKKQLLAEQLEDPCHQQLMTQSTFQDTLLKIQKNYLEVKSQQNFLQKFPSSWQFIMKYHYPFVLDIPSSRKFLDQNRRPGTMHYQLLRQYQKSQPKPLKKLIQQELDYFISTMEEQVRQSDKWKLLQVQPFTSAQACINFLQNLKAGGGADPPQAVIDGMEAAANLKWTVDNKTLRFIFHLLDAPPHSEKYDTNNQDYFPQGCPCGISMSSVISKIAKNKINYYIYPLTSRVKKTLKVLQEEGLNFKQQNIQKQKPKQFTQHVSNLIIQKIEQVEFMVRK